MKYIRSYNDFSHEFRLKSGKSIVVPSRAHSPKNVIEVTDEELDELKEIDTFRALMESGVQQYRVLDKMPKDALDIMEKLAIANDETERAKAEKAEAEVAASKARQELEILKKRIDEQGGIESVSAEVDQARAEAAKAKEEAENLAAEVAELKKKLKQKVEKAE